MLTQSVTEKDSASGVTPPIQPRMPWRVVEVHPLPDYRLRVRFVDGLEGTVDMHGLVYSPDAGVFAQLADPVRFAQVFIEHGAVTWPGEIDLAPDAMYRVIKDSGAWVVR